jgi:hypothetical protein
MSHALRNTLTLALILTLTSALGIYWTAWHQVSQLEALADQHDTLKTELDALYAVTSLHESAQAAVDSLHARWTGRTQIVPVTDTPTLTIAYLDQLQQLAGGTLSFDLLHLGHKAEEGFATNRYALTGEAPFRDLYAFTRLLEYGRLFYTLDGMEIEYQEPEHGILNVQDRWVHFRLLFRSYCAPPTRHEEVRIPENKPLASDLPNPFRPQITRSLPANTQELFDIADARLQALTGRTAYITDRNGKMSTLATGDRVYLGRLDLIDIANNKVEFLLNKGGIWQRVSLAMDPGTIKPGEMQ